MKSIQKALECVFAVSLAFVTGCGMIGGGGGGGSSDTGNAANVDNTSSAGQMAGQMPAVVSVNPSSAAPGSTVTLSLSNFDFTNDVVLFGGVAANVSPDPNLKSVAAVPPDMARGSVQSYGSYLLSFYDTQDVRIGQAKSTAKSKSLDDAPLVVTVAVVVPPLQAGDTGITALHGNDESAPVSFTVTGSGTAAAPTPAPAQGGRSGGIAIPPPSTTH